MPKCSFSTSPDERWKPVVGYEKSYVVSTSGRVACPTHREIAGAAAFL